MTPITDLTSAISLFKTLLQETERWKVISWEDSGSKYKYHIRLATKSLIIEITQTSTADWDIYNSDYVKQTITFTFPDKRNEKQELSNTDIKDLKINAQINSLFATIKKKKPQYTLIEAMSQL